MKKVFIFAAALLLSAWSADDVRACTGIAFQTAKGEYIQARTIEWGGYNLNSKLVIIPRGQKNVSLTPQGKNGMAWTARYGMAGASTVMEEFVTEGLNEKGLSAGIFYFPHYGSLAPYNPRKARRSVSDAELVRWLLGNFATVDEALKGLKKITVIPVDPGKDGVPASTGHWRLADALGKSAVIEITDGGKLHVYANKAGVLTNSPGFDWQLANLNNYVNLRAGAAPAQDAGGVKLFPFGAGSGFLGLPGDVTPPSRFVRAFFYLHSAPVPADARAGMMQAFHILNNFDIPIGSEFSPGETIPDLPSATQWTSVSDLTNKIFYYKTMHNNAIRQINLPDIDFASVTYIVRPLDENPGQPTQVLSF